MMNQIAQPNFRLPKVPKKSRDGDENFALDYTDMLRWRALKNGTIYITDEVGESMAEDIDMEILELQRRGIKDIKIVIISPGGSVHPGLAIYDALMAFRASGGKVTTLAQGYAASMGAVILQAGNERIAYKNSKILIHEVSQFHFFSRETITDAEEAAKELRKVNDQLVKILSERSGLDPSKVASLIKKKDYWMTAAEARELNFIDKVI